MYKVFDTGAVVEQFRGVVIHGETPGDRVERKWDLFKEILDTDEVVEMETMDLVRVGVVIARGLP